LEANINKALWKQAFRDKDFEEIKKDEEIKKE